MPPVANDVREDRRRLRRAFRLSASFAALLWGVELLELLFDLNLASLGVHPRRLDGLPGLALMPLVHGSWSHLVSNTLPVLILGTALLYAYPRSARIVIPAVYLGSGLGVWLFGRDAWHIGASGVVFGVMFFLLTIGILRWDKQAIAIAMVVFFLYGSAIWGIFPLAPGISFESHLSGALIGVILAVVLRHHDPAPAEEHYSWEDEDENADEQEPPWQP